MISKFNGDALIGDEMGLGKTFTSLLWAVENEEWPVVIVCPAHLKYNWQEEIKLHFGARSLVLEGRNTSVQKHFIPNYKFVIINFQILEAWLPILRKLRPRTLILDECQSISNRESQSYHNFCRLRSRAANFLALSGTPLLNRAAEMWAVLNLLRPDVWPSFFTYAVKHCEPKRERGKMTYRGSRNLDQLHQEMKKYCMIRRLKSDVLDLPPKVRHVVPLPMTANSDYREAEVNFKRWIEKHKGKSSLVKAVKSLSLAKMSHYRQLCIEAKMPSVIKWVENFLSETDEKLILMFTHTAPIEQMMLKFKKIAVRVDGKITGRLRQAAVKEFQNSETCRLFVGNTKAAGSGLTLTAAHHLAFCEFPWTPGETKQVEDRAHRISQTETTFIYYLVANGSVEEKMAKTIAKKDDILNKVLDDGRNEQWKVDELIKKAKR
jgi:SWI/SNF-related matrix-associated actin-dependent regulator 1 of chromatin subfamily A